jgi:mRNA-degrading endonuclease RelE of RelBE toxin-antitoxin system
VTYRAELSSRALKQMHRLPGPAFDRLIETMAEVIDYPDDPLRTLPTSDPYVRRVEFGDAGLITYLINDGTSVVIILDVTWVC